MTLVISLAIILGIFVMRYSLLNKIYLPFSGMRSYYKQLATIKNEISRISIDQGATAADNYRNTVIFPTEPKYITSIQLAFVLLFLALVSFILLISIKIAWLTVSTFILFICLVVASISIFSVQLYREGEFKQMKEDTDKEIWNKINEFFSDKVTPVSDYQNQSDILNPIRTIIIRHPKKGLFRIECNANDPNRYFNIEHIQSAKKQAINKD